MTNTTTVNAIEMVKAAGLVDAGEIRLFVMETRAITIEVLKCALTDLFVTLPAGKKTKIVYADLFARAMEMEIDLEDEGIEKGDLSALPSEDNHISMNLSATGETLVAETKTEEVVEMTAENKVAQELQRIQNEKNMKALMNSNLLKKEPYNVFSNSHVAGLSKEIQAMLDKAESAKAKYFHNIGENEVEVMDIVFYPEKKDATREEIRANKVVRERGGKNANGTEWSQKFIGEVVVRLPKNYAQIKHFNRNLPNPNTGKMGMNEWIDFNGFDADFTKAYNTSLLPADGSNLIVLAIKEGKDGKPRVNLPVEPNKQGGNPWPIFKTADVRYINSKNAIRHDEPMYVADNNAWFNAQVSAFIQVFSNEFVVENIGNRNGFNESCATCFNSIRLMTRDEVNGDIDDSRKSRAVLESPDIMQLAQAGSNQPMIVCGLDERFKDIAATLKLNEAEQFESTEYVDEEGRLRFQAYNEIMDGGKAINKMEYRTNATQAEAEACVHYHGNSPKSEAQVAKEKSIAREEGKSDYVSPFYKTAPRIGRQAIQTLVDVEGKELWIPKFPGEVDEPLAFRVKSAALTVYGSADVMGLVDPEFVAPVEEFDARHADVMRKINQIFYAAFNLHKLDETQATVIFEMADKKPEGITADEESRWDKAVYWLAQSLVWAQEREANRQAALFTTKFHVGYVDGATSIEVADIMGETLRRAEEGTIGYGLGYADLLPSEFTRYLDEVAMDKVYEVITKGTEFCVVEGTTKDMELAAGALQAMLQRELTSNFYVFADGARRDVSLVSNVRRDENPGEALAKLNVCDEVRTYIANLVGISK